MKEERDYLLAHRCHDYEALIDRWRRVAESAGLRMEVLGESDDFPIYFIDNERATSRGKGLYLSAGVHGDEPGATEGLIEWAERSGEFLSNYPVTLFPCFNPWGLENNCRLDGQDRDLNRLFDDAKSAPMRQWQAILRGREYRVALCLHEDYDATGAYVYELARESNQVGERLLLASDEAIPRHAGGEIEGRAASEGVVIPDQDIAEVLKEIEGMPEAIYLYLHHTDTSLTYETPSEYSLFDRVAAQGRVLDEVVKMLAETGEGTGA